MKSEFKKAIAVCAPPARKKLEELHGLVMSTAKNLEGVGKVSEELRWGQPSFLTQETGSGSTIRMDGLRGDPKRVALYFHCQSGLVPQFRELYADKFTFEKDRAILLPVDKPLPRAELAHCISLALTHHLRKKSVVKKRK
jgi:Domain of unknown function (DU1801)